jgi:hypothetical protein
MFVCMFSPDDPLKLLVESTANSGAPVRRPIGLSGLFELHAFQHGVKCRFELSEVSFLRDEDHEDHGSVLSRQSYKPVPFYPAPCRLTRGGGRLSEDLPVVIAAAEELNRARAPPGSSIPVPA